MNKPKTPPRYVDFLNHEDDHACILLAALGYSTAYICRQTGLTQSQVSYRIMKSELTLNGMSRAEFRNGESPFSQIVLRSARVVADKELFKHLRKLSGEQHTSGR